MANKFYAVAAGRTTGIFNSWDECEASVKGFPGARYKAFSSLDEARLFIGSADAPAVPAASSPSPFEPYSLSLSCPDPACATGSPDGFGTYVEHPKRPAGWPMAPEELRPTAGSINAYTDGSFSSEKNAYGFGLVLIFHDGSTAESFGIGNLPEFLGARNVAGECMAAIEALSQAVENKASSIVIRHDYEGISAWPLGLWKAKSPAAKALVRSFFQARENGLDIRFEKVKGHSGNQGNDIADTLASFALRTLA